ncbi:Gfo/Idh/MocA family protein [Cohnella sp. GCM10027633]|uniref:Gfo/Idh/MocA family protein n=1 Tax=unclassified Cohnella TaxID=2636738 RepID=UPI00363AB355
MTIKFAIAGTGWVAGQYFQAILSNEGAELTAVYSKNRERAVRKLKELGVEARVYDDFEDMVKNPLIDAVILCSTPDVRPSQAIMAAREGKHLVLEKPLALDPASMGEMAEAIARTPVKTVASFVLRWNPAFNMTKALIEDDALGRIHMAQIDYWHHVGPQYAQYRWSSGKALGGSSILSAGCHAVDALRYFAGDVVEVFAYGSKTWDHSEYGFDPNALAICRLKNGGLGKVSSSLECKTTYKFNVHLLGEKGTMLNNKLFSHKFPGQTDYADIPTQLPDSGDVSHHPFQAEINDFVDAIRYDRTTKCDFFDAYKSMEVSFAIDESIATGAKVVLPH